MTGISPTGAPTRRGLLAWLGIGSSTLAAGAPAPAVPSRPPLRLLFTRVMGERYYDAPERFDWLTPGDPVTLRREPDNPHDRRAMVFDEHGYKLGYVARIDNPAAARMMDAGERFVARVARLAPLLDIRIAVDWLRG